MSYIEDVVAREVLDSRGNPTTSRQSPGAATLSTLQRSQWERRSLQKDGCKAGNTENTAMTGSQRYEPPTKSPSGGWRGWSRQNQAGVTLCRIPIWMYHFKIRTIFYQENVLLY